MHLDEKVRVVLSNEDAYKVYHDACEKVENERDLAITIMLAGLGAITMGASVPVSYAVIAASGAISYGIETSPEDIDYIDLLGGEYTVNTFKMETDLDGLSRNNRKIVYEGLIIHGDPIILDNGEIIDNPLNTIVFKCTEFH